MTQKIYKKKIPFTIELAKQITSGKKKGEIVTRDGKQARILSYGLKNGIYPIVAAVKQNENVGENAEVYTTDGKWDDEGESPNDLFIRVPTYYKDYSNFTPEKWQPCVVRSSEDGTWFVAVCDKITNSGEAPTFYPSGLDKLFRSSVAYRYYLPLTKVTQRLLRQTISYEQLIEELDYDKG